LVDAPPNGGGGEEEEYGSAVPGIGTWIVGLLVGGPIGRTMLETGGIFLGDGVG